MTTGTRIAQKRKELGLSQEQLGEQLSVSRQSIYKWESDTVLPEVEKLVALSKLFSVTVGWLLGVEEGSKDTWDGELSEAQLRMVEEIAAQYRPVPDKKKRRQFMAAAAVVAVIIAAVFIALFARMSKLQHGYNMLQGQVGTMQGELHNQIDNITNQVTSALEQQTKITSSRDATVQSADLAANTVTFAVTAIPKTYTEGTEAVFIAESEGKSVEAPAALGDGQRFSGTVTCPLSDEITVSVAFISDGTRQTEVIYSFYDLYSASVRYGFNQLTGFGENGQLDEGGYSNSMSEDYSYGIVNGIPQSEPVQIRAGLFCDKKLVKWLTPIDDVPDGGPIDDEVGVYFQNDKTVPFEKGHSYTIVIVVTDNYGRDLCYPDWTYTYTNGEWSHAEATRLPITADLSGDWQF